MSANLSVPPAVVVAATLRLPADLPAGAAWPSAGVKLTPEMVKMSADMMSKMTPEDMERMRAMHSAAPSGGTAAAAPPTAPRQPSVANTTIHDDVKIEDITGQEVSESYLSRSATDNGPVMEQTTKSLVRNVYGASNYIVFHTDKYSALLLFYGNGE